MLSSTISASSLDRVIEDVRNDFPSISHLTAAKIKQLLFSENSDSERSGWLLLDIREVEEYQRSHLPGAIRISPAISQDEFSNTLNRLIANRDPKTLSVLVYCSVGRRSSALATRLMPQMSSFKQVVNLEGGLFHWVKQGYPLVSGNTLNSEQPTNEVHPYNWWWGRLLND